MGLVIGGLVRLPFPDNIGPEIPIRDRYLLPQDAAQARAALADAPNVSVVEIPIEDGWARDWGASVRALGRAAGGSWRGRWLLLLLTKSRAPVNPRPPRPSLPPLHAQWLAKDEGGKRIVAATHWDYDAYGGTLKNLLVMPTMMPDWTLDYEAGRKMVEWCGQQVFEAPIHVEGGSIHSDGEG